MNCEELIIAKNGAHITMECITFPCSFGVFVGVSVL